MRLDEYAKAYLGVPFQHQGRYHYALDCGGLLVLSARDKGVELTDISGYHRSPDSHELKTALDTQLTRVSRKPISGDVLLMAIGKNPQHIAIKTDIGIIHAFEKAGGVVEHELDAKWSKRIKGVYAL